MVSGGPPRWRFVDAINRVHDLMPRVVCVVDRRPRCGHGLMPKERELLSNVVFVRRESGGVLQDSVGKDSSLGDERELMACVEASPATCR